MLAATEFPQAAEHSDPIRLRVRSTMPSRIQFEIPDGLRDEAEQVAAELGVDVHTLAFHAFQGYLDGVSTARGDTDEHIGFNRYRPPGTSRRTGHTRARRHRRLAEHPDTRQRPR